MKEKLNKYLKEALYYFDLPGLAVSAGIGVFRYKNVVGYKNYKTKEELELNDVFHMASVSKLFTSTAILQLIQEGKLALEDLIVDVLPWFRVNDKKLNEITIEKLLTHTSGLGDVNDYHWDKPEIDEGALKRYVQSEEVKNSKLLWNPSENRFSYSNMAYEILGCVVSKISNMPFEEYIAKNIFEPLEMKNSNFLTFKRDKETLAKPHKKDCNKHIILEKDYPYNRAHGPSSTFTTDICDIEKWAEAHLNKKMFAEIFYEKIWHKYVTVPNNGEGMSLGWFIRQQKEYELLGHEGSDNGFRASFWICPELNAYVAVMTNISSGRSKKINKQIFDMLVKMNNC